MSEDTLVRSMLERIGLNKAASLVSQAQGIDSVMELHILDDFTQSSPQTRRRDQWLNSYPDQWLL